MKVFSFCLYGTEPNYYTGLLENIAIVREQFPDFSIYVYKGVCDPSWVIPDGVIVIETGREGGINMFYRLLPLTFAEIGFTRDADSRITERDQWCIREFLESDKSYHVIRDHYYHRSKIMGGLFGWKKSLSVSILTDRGFTYGDDEAFLASDVYPTIRNDILVHTNCRAFVAEDSRRIQIPPRDSADFIGNVIWNGVPKFHTITPILEYVRDLVRQDQFAIIKYLTDSLNPLSVPYHSRSEFFEQVYRANFYAGDLAKACYWVSQFEFAEITQMVKHNTSYLIPRLAPNIVASFDPTREPAEDEVVIVYGAYPDWHLALPCSRKLYRHVSLLFDTKHTKVESHSCWDPIQTIYILNLEERIDRYYETLLTLASVRAPIDRVKRYIAKKDGLPPYVGATKNHVDVITEFCETGKGHCLILEDDFVFIDDHPLVWRSLETLWSKPRSYDICFVSLSRHGQREPLDDLLSMSKQECTTSSGYILQAPTAPLVRDVTAEGLELMQTTGNHHIYCIDRYWSKLEHIVFFKTKLGFQRPSYSNLIGRAVAHLD
jgi:hypothetical protein